MPCFSKVERRQTENDIVKVLGQGELPGKIEMQFLLTSYEHKTVTASRWRLMQIPPACLTAD